MNLGQLLGLVDVELLHRAPDRPAAPAPCAPLGVVTHRARNTEPEEIAPRKIRGRPATLQGRVRTLLAAASEPLSLEQVHAAMPEVTLERVRGAIHQAATSGDVERKGIYGASRYLLTAQGRDKSPSHNEGEES